MKLHVAKSPCASCPYRRDVPSGIWHRDEYEKLREYDRDGSDGQIPPIAVFHCHKELDTKVPTVCRGWLTVHSESIAVRFAQITGLIDPMAIYAKVKEKLYRSGNEAADAGEKGIKRPSRAARSMAEKLLRNGKRKL